jgi:MYXO-CTERM domain-containing protein
MMAGRNAACREGKRSLRLRCYNILRGASIMRALAVTILLAIPTAAFAGVAPTPGPEAGVGAGAMVAVAAGYLFLKRRRSR